MLSIIKTNKADQNLQELMAIHYSHPKGFVGRQLFYRVEFDSILYGCIAFGSVTRFLPGRNLSFHLNEGLNNIFYHIEKRNNAYPFRNFTTKVLLESEKKALHDYEEKYGDKVKWLETLVELPRTGELYKRAGYNLVGQTKGYTCKRIAGQSSDAWSGKRVWDTKTLKPKHVFIKIINY